MTSGTQATGWGLVPGLPSVRAASTAWSGRQKPISYFIRQVSMKVVAVAASIRANNRVVGSSPSGSVSR